MRILNLIVFVFTFGYVSTYLYQHTADVSYTIKSMEPVIAVKEPTPSQSVNPNLKSVTTKKPQDYYQIRLARAISSLYAHVSFEKALVIVKHSYRYGERHNVKPTLLLGIIATESSFKQHAVSSHGAVGLTQVLPKWHQDKIQGRDLYDLHVNLEVGSRILGDCFKSRRNQVSALACYNGATTEDSVTRYVTKVTTKKQEILKLASI